MWLKSRQKRKGDLQSDIKDVLRLAYVWQMYLFKEYKHEQTRHFKMCVCIYTI